MDLKPAGQITPEALLTKLKWRYAVKKFDAAKKIPAQTWDALEATLVLSPSSYGLQPWKFFVVNNPAIRERLLAASHNQRQVVDASHMVVFAMHLDLGEKHVTKHIDRIATVRNVPVDSLAGYKSMMVNSAQSWGDPWHARQVYIALGMFMSAAALLGVDTCPMEGIEPAQYEDILSLKERGFKVLCVCTAGYRAADDKYAHATKVRFEHSDVVEKI